MQILYYADKDFTDNSESDKGSVSKKSVMASRFFIYLFFQINYFIEFFVA
jgi:hypothetical protein